MYYRTIRNGRMISGIRFYIDDYGSIEEKKKALLMREELHRTEMDMARINELLDTGTGEVCPEEIRPRLHPPAEAI